MRCGVVFPCRTARAIFSGSSLAHARRCFGGMVVQPKAFVVVDYDEGSKKQAPFEPSVGDPRRVYVCVFRLKH